MLQPEVERVLYCTLKLELHFLRVLTYKRQQPEGYFKRRTPAALQFAGFRGPAVADII
jgi:hypothetical protein